MSEIHTLLERFRRHADAFNASTSLVDFAARIADTGDGRVLAMPGYQNPHGWPALTFRGAKVHGLDFSPHRPLFVPEARDISELVEDVRYLPLPMGGLYRDQALALVGGRSFVSGLRARESVPFGHVGGKREWSPEWLKKGEKVRRISGATSYGTYCRPRAVITQGLLDGGYGDDRVSTLELVRWDDGRTLVTARYDDYPGTPWLALIDAGKCDLAALMPEADRELIAANRAADIAAWGE